MNNTGAGKASSFKPYLYTVAALSGLLLTIAFTGSYPNFVETYYTGKLYQAISFVWHLLLSWIPVSVGDVFYLAVIICLLITLLNLFRDAFRRQFKNLGVGLLKLLVGFQIFISAFYLLWGMNYSRPPAAEILNLPDSAYTLPQLQSITRLLIDSANVCRAALTPADKKISNTAVYLTAVTAIKGIAKLHPAFRSFYPAAKSSVFTPIINFMGMAGYFNPFSSEAQVNYAMPLINKPLTACHEMAHQMGFAREDEANFVGFLAGIRSGDRLLQYSAYYLAVQEFMQQVYRRDTVTFHQLKSHISIPVKNDMKAERLYWQHYQSQLGNVVGIFYDGFLKANKQPEGMRTYNRMVNLTVAYYRRDHGRWAIVHRP